MLLLPLFLAAMGVASGSSHHEVLAGHQVWKANRFLYELPRLLKELEEDGFIDILGTTDEYVQFRVFPDYLDQVRGLLKERNIAYEAFITDLQLYLENQEQLENVEEREAKQECSRESCVRPLSNAYMTYNEIENYLLNIDNSRASIEVIGVTEEGRNIWAVKIVPNDEQSLSPTSLRGVFIEGGIHAREWISPAVTLHLIHYLLENPEQGEGIAFNIVPIANPDGYEYSHRTDRMWRKNRSKKGSSSCPGVDLNRNWGYKFGVGASSSYCSQVYKGPAPFSEPETKAVRKAMIDTPNLKFVLALHSYGQVLVYPWGWTTSRAPNTYALRRMGARITNAIYRKSGLRYGVANSASKFGLASGATDDWAKGVLKVKYSYTLELRDTGRNGFLLPASQINITSDEIWEGLKAALNGIRAESA